MHSTMTTMAHVERPEDVGAPVGTVEGGGTGQKAAHSTVQLTANEQMHMSR